MTCGCKKKHKRGSGRAQFLSGVTWHKGSGMRWDGSGFHKKKRKKKASGFPDVTKYGRGPIKRRRKKKRGGMSMTGGGVNFSGGGFPFSGGSFLAPLSVAGALQMVMNKRKNGRRVI